VDSNQQFAIILALGVIIVSGAIIVRRFRNGRLISLAGGLHANTLISMGVGPLFYVLSPQYFDTERIDHATVIQHALLSNGLFLLGYLIVIGLELMDRGSISDQAIVRRLRGFSEIQIYFLFVLGSSGIIAVNLGLNTSGVGTLFNIIYLFIFPIVALVIVRMDNKRPSSWATALFIISVVGAYCLTSYWRSLSLVFGLSILLGITMKIRLQLRWTLLMSLFFVGWYIWLFPFLQLKKANAPTGATALFNTFIESQEMPIGLRMQESLGFLGLRTNGVREIGYLEAGLATNAVQLRWGESYKETLLQMIPRVVWPGKPSYNTSMNYELPRTLGLLGWDDTDTSSGVGLWAEAVWNLKGYFLLVYVPLLFGLMTWIDRLIWRARLDMFFKWWMLTCLFYLSLQVLNLVNFVTLVMWTILLIYLYGKTFSLAFGEPREGR
jgi:hypothetical protein